jgi:uncharacterized membrane protein
MAERSSQLSERPAEALAKCNPALASVIERNIATLIERRRREETDRLASPLSGHRHAVHREHGLQLFASVLVGVATNTGLVPLIRPRDPSFAILRTVASIEAIFLSTFILIRQNRTTPTESMLISTFR